MKLKKLGMGLFATVLVGCMGLSATVYGATNNHRISQKDSGSMVNQTTTYYLKTEYDFGSWLPGDDAYLYTESKAKSNIYLKVYTRLKLNNGSYRIDEKKGYHQLSGVRGYYAYSGSDVDYATGNGYAIIYKGNTSSSGENHRQNITVY